MQLYDNQSHNPALNAQRNLTKRAALKLLQRGLVTQSEAARLAGVSRQLMRKWAKDCPNSRPDYLQKIWNRALEKSETKALQNG